jgi:hypothetical protein
MTDMARHLPERITWLRAAVSSIPAVGGALDHLIFDKADAIRVKNIEVALAAIKQQIESVEDESIDKEWFQSEEALATFKMMSDKISYEPDPGKVEAIGRVVSACGNKQHSKDPHKLSVVEHLSRLSATQIKLLSIVSEIEPKERTIEMGGLNQTGSAIWLSDIIAALQAGPQFWQGKLVVDEELEVLESLNTVRRVQFMGPAELAYVVTTIGKRAAAYVHTAGL